jgi:hypothetical protein
LWHEIKGLGERAFVGARQYDVTMNSIIDAVRLNQMLMVKGGNAESTKKLKQMEWLPVSVLPEDIDFAQNRFEIPTEESLRVLQQSQNDLYSGIGQYRINAPTRQNRQRTARETEIDAAESAKLSGSQIRLFNESETLWQRETFRRFVSMKDGENGYDIFEKFKRMMREMEVPEEAYAWDSIEIIQSNMLFGAGSPSQKLMAAEKTIQITGMTPANEGQFNAMRDAVAALNTRAMVDRYLPKQPDPFPEQYRVISMENAGLNDPLANLENFRVLPTDNHIDHIRGHFGDAMMQVQRVMQGAQTGEATKQQVFDTAISTNLKGGHITAHIEFLARDGSKQNEVKTIVQNISLLLRMANELLSMEEQMPDQQQQGGMSEAEIDLQKKAAMAAIEVDTKQKLADIKAATTAAQHELTQELTRQKAALDLAIKSSKPQKQTDQKPKKNED